MRMGLMSRGQRTPQPPHKISGSGKAMFLGFNSAIKHEASETWHSMEILHLLLLLLFVFKFHSL